MKKCPSVFQPTGRTHLSHRRPLNLDFFWFGVCYYPEHWDDATRREDPARMAAAGVNIVRMGDFAWDVFEPEEGRFDFSLFDETIDRMAEAGIWTILCTPTAGPPRWLTRKHPEILRRDAGDVAMRHGSRQHASHAHPIFRRYCKKITSALARHYARSPHVVAWQTDNEIYCHFADDHGPEMQTAFRDYLKRAYRNDIHALNRAWGTSFWAQTYRSFADIETPRTGRPTYGNPSALLDYARLLSDVAENFQHDQAAILRAANPAWRIFHNGVMRRVDYRGPFSQDLDFLGFDVYPFFTHNPADRSCSEAFNHDRTRSLTGNFLVPEHQSSHGGQPDYIHNTPEPGEMRLMTYASIARGADGLIYFRWRACRFGAEMSWGGILDHDNVPRARYDELRQIGGEISRVGPAVLSTSVYCDVAVATGDYDVREGNAAYSIGLPSEQIMAEGAHRTFFEKGYAVGCVHPEDDLSQIKLYIIPHWCVFDPAWIPGLTDFVSKGGTLLIGARTATRDLNNHVVADTLPGCLRVLAGATVEGYTRENPGSDRPKSILWGKSEISTEYWNEWLQPDPGTEVLGIWKGRHYDGKAAMTSRKHGKGRVLYVGTYLTVAFLRAIRTQLTKIAGLEKNWPAASDGVEVVRREGKKERIWFFLNHTDKTVILKTTPNGINLLTGKSTHGKSLGLPRHGAAVICAKSA